MKRMGVSLFLFAAVPAFGQPFSVTPQDRSVEPVVLTGAQFPTWTGGPDPTLREPDVPGYPNPDTAHIESDCANQVEEDGTTDHNCYQSSRVRSPVPGVDVTRLRGYKWDGSQFIQIPFQVDQKFTRYLSNNASGFAFYSGTDQYETYVFDREGFRYTWDKQAVTGTPTDSNCLAWANAKDRTPPVGALPRDNEESAWIASHGTQYATTPDPLIGLHDDDELVLMARDAGAEAPSTAALPEGIASGYKVLIADPFDPTNPKYAYVMLTGENGPPPAYTAENSPYVRYARDPNADILVYSQSSYGNYGNAPKGPYCLPDGTPDTSHGQTAQRRALDTAWVKTPRYEFRYGGRWLMTQLDVNNSAGGNADPDPVNWTYDPSIIDRWKARAFAQDPESHTPCCGYEEEQNNWGGSSILLGEKWGPVRVIRETWGADSSTNNVRREVFYRDLFEWGDALRVHPIPPLDGIYVQWDHRAGMVDTYYNPFLPGGLPIDGTNKVLYGNFDDPCDPNYGPNGVSQIDATYHSIYRQAGLCSLPYHWSLGMTDLTKQSPQATLQWEEVSGTHGTMVSRWSLRDVTPGGAAQGVFAIPYFRDDSCFDDGTGSDPGPHVNVRNPETGQYRDYGISLVDGKAYVPPPVGSTPIARKCWTPADGLPDPNFAPQGDVRYFQGDIGTHGLHLLFIAESDNAMMTVPLDEIDSQQRVVLLPGCSGGGAACNVGERYGRNTEYPLKTIATPM